MNDRALKWITGRDTGSSSNALWAVMMGQKGDGDSPSDPDDLGRCLRLLELVPEWKSRIGEMSAASPYWAALVGIWPQLEASMREEYGPCFAKPAPARKSYALMRSVLEPVEKADKRFFRLGEGVSVRF